MKKSKDVIIIGLALFAMFFGAGNLIFPPKLGAELGSSWTTGVLGFSLADAGISFIAIIAVALSDGKIHTMGEKVHPKFGIFLGIIVALILGPLLSVPRTGAVAYEMGIKPIFPQINLFWFSLIYFAIAFVILMDPKNIIDKIGKVLTPLLLLGLSAIIIKGIMSPSVIPGDSTLASGFGTSILEGYQTVDGLGALLLTGFVINSLREKGYKKKKTILRMTIYAAILASILVTVIYASLMYLGATQGALFPQDISRSNLFTSIVYGLLGNVGMDFMALAVTMACFTTAVGLTATIGKFFEENIFKHRIKYKWIVAGMMLISFALSNLGVELIIKASEPVLKIVYPVTVVLILLKLVEKYLRSKITWRLAVLGCLIINIPGFCHITGIHFPFATPLSIGFPMVEWEMEWLIPSILVALIVEGIYRLVKRNIIEKDLKTIKIK
ncbi:MAG: branched-chain amino acid transport system II carrier protein [Bacteroidales bacterium]